MTAGLHGITVSLLGADAATHDALQAVDGAFDELKAGLENVSSLVREGALPVSVNVNLIVSAKSVDSLARMVRLAMSLGAIAGSVHLVKFDSLGADPGVREPLRFDIRRMRGALLEGFAACADSGFRMHAADVPLCLHPKLTLDEVRRATARASIEGHAYSAAAFNFSGDSRNSGVDRAPCRTCLLKASCPRVPAEYLPDDPASALVALTESSIGAWVDETLASVDPSDDGSTRQLVVFGRTLRELAALTGDPAALSASRTKVREAIADLALVAAAEARTSRALPALLAYLGLDPPTTTPSFRGPIPKPRSFEPTSGALLQFIDGYRVWLQGHWESADSFAITSFEPLVPKDASQRMARLGHLFAAATTWVLWGAKRLRIARRAVEAERGEGKAREWATILMQDQEGAVTLRALSPDALARGPDV